MRLYVCPLCLVHVFLSSGRRRICIYIYTSFFMCVMSLRTTRDQSASVRVNCNLAGYIVLWPCRSRQHVDRRNTKGRERRPGETWKGKREEATEHVYVCGFFTQDINTRNTWFKVYFPFSGKRFNVYSYSKNLKFIFFFWVTRNLDLWGVLHLFSGKWFRVYSCSKILKFIFLFPDNEESWFMKSLTS